jgi:parvulin-like peptidyl-prolyl isomerase
VKIKVPKERQDLIRESLEPKFQETVEVIRKKENKATVQELDEFLSGQGTSVEELRQSFYRIQMVEGYLSSLIKVPEKVDREELLRYYEDHLRDYSSEEKVRVAKIVVRPGKGGIAQAQQQADDIIARIGQGQQFQELAAELSDPVNRDKRGDMGWISRGALAPELEDIVFGLAVGDVSAPRVLADRVEIYSITDRHEPSTIPFQQVQTEIEETILNQKREDARREVRDQIRNRGSVQTVLE